MASEKAVGACRGRRRKGQVQGTFGYRISTELGEVHEQSAVSGGGNY